jgi:hypothetical protein
MPAILRRVGISGAEIRSGAPPSWRDGAWWEAKITAAVDCTDPVLSNVRITLAHGELSIALNHITGSDSGANFHTWAVWGSKKAGRTIRREDVPWLPGVAAALGAGATGVLFRRVPQPRALVATAAAGGVAHALIRRLLGRTATQIYGGNVTVLDDIGRQTARFVSTFLDPAGRTDERLEHFLAPLRTGPPEAGGQDLLRGAYRHYLEASRSPAGDRRDELMLTANLLAILHEHHRLDPYIDTAMPWPVRRLVTRRLLTFNLGPEAMQVSHDVTSNGATAFPETLGTIELPELNRLLRGPGGLDRTPDSLLGSGARDWSDLGDRMNFIVDLFRTRQFDDTLFAPPFAPQEWDALIRGHPNLRSLTR